MLACSFSTKPPNNKEFAFVSDLKKYEGLYVNRGVPNDYFSYLSRIFWNFTPEFWSSPYIKRIRAKFPNPKYPSPAHSTSRELEFKRMVHETIKHIQIEADKNKVTITAINNKKCYLFKKIYRENVDFKIKNGKIFKIHSKSQQKGHSPVVGLNHGERAIGLDMDGHGKFKLSSFSIGLAYLIYPLAMSESTEIRFTKLKEKFKINECKKS